MSKSERTREAILEAAEARFSRFGFAGTSLDAIGDDAGIKGTAILYHYPTKQDLYHAVLDRIFEPLIADIRAELTASGPLNNRMEELAAVMVRFAAARPHAANLVLREAYAGGDEPGVLGEAVAPHWRHLLQALEEEGQTGVSIDPQIIWSIIIGAVCFYYTAGSNGGVLPHDPQAPEQVDEFERVMRHVTRSLLELKP